MLARVKDGKVVSIIRPGQLGSLSKNNLAGKVVPVVEEGGSFNPVYQARLGPKTVVESDRVRLIYTVSSKETAVEDLQADLVQKVNAIFSRKADSVTKQIPDQEISTWPQQKVEAEARALDVASEAPLLTAIATARGLPVGELAARVLTKASAFSAMVGGLLGRKQALEDLIELGINVPELLSLEEELEKDW